MKYPTLKSLHKKLICEATVSEFNDAFIEHTDLQVVIEVLEELIDDDFKNYAGMKSFAEDVRTVLENWKENKNSDVKAELAKIWPSNSNMTSLLNFFILGIIDYTRGFAGTLKKIQQILSNIPPALREDFVKFTQGLGAKDAVKLVHDFINSSPHLYAHEMKDIFFNALFYNKHLSKFDSKLLSWKDAFMASLDSAVTDDIIPYGYEFAFSELNELVNILKQNPKLRKIGPMQIAQNQQRFIIKAVHDIFEEGIEDDPAKVRKKLIEGMKKTLNSGFQVFTSQLLWDIKYGAEKILIKEDIPFQEFIAALWPVEAFMRELDNDVKLKKIRYEEFSRSFDPERVIRTLGGQLFVDCVIDVLTGNTNLEGRISTLYSAYTRLKPEIRDNAVNLLASTVDAIKERLEKLRIEDDALKKQVPPEVPPNADAPLEDYAFADQRYDVPRERNTEVEEKLRKHMVSHFHENVPLSSEDAEMIKNFISKGYYHDIFHEPIQKHVYRGMVVTEEWLLNSLSETQIEKMGSKKASFNFSPRRGGASSWSSSISEALKFADEVGDAKYSVMLISKVDDNPSKFVMGEGGFYDIKSFDSFKHEKEVIALGTVKVIYVIWKFEDALENSDIRKYIGHLT